MWVRYYKAFLVILCVLIPGIIIGHDFYLLSNHFVFTPGRPIRIHRYINDNFPAPPENWDPGHIVGFQVLSRSGAVDLAALRPTGRPSAPELSFEAEGTYLLVYVSKPSFITLPAEKFEEYLKKEGLDQVIAARKQQDRTNADGREQYSRYAKVLLQVGRTPDDTFSKIAGLKLEIVPEQNPYKIKAGQKLTAKVLFDGKPLVNALVSAKCAGPMAKEGNLYSARTDRSGRVSIPLAAPGVWLIRLVHMLPYQGPRATDWESFWGSLTFEMVN
jgi:hypothetical protein